MAKKKGGAKAALSAVPLGGVGEIGMNLMVYECDGDMLLVDVGMMLQDPDAPGVDVVLPDIKYIRENIKKLKGIIITHAHEDHIGAMPYWWSELPAPVYMTPFAANVMRHKLRDLGYGEEEYSRINEVSAGGRVDIGAFNAEFIHITHSIPETCAIALRTPHGNILHTADYKFDDDPSLNDHTDEEALKRFGDEGVLALLGDSTNAFSPGKSPSEGSILPQLEEVLKDTKERLFFSSFASNIGRVIRMVELASKHGRKVCLLGFTVRRMMEHAKACGYVPKELNNWLVEPDDVAHLKRNEVMVFASGTQGELNASLSRLSKGETVRGVKMEFGDTVLMSSKMIPGNERGILNVINNFAIIGVHVVHEKMADIHVSGHGYQDDLKHMYDLVRPQIVVPVHGESAHLLAQADVAKAHGVPQQLLFHNGDRIVFGPGEPQVQEHFAPCGRSYVDGMNILDIDRFILKDRKHMGYNGAVSVAVVVDKKGKRKGLPQLRTAGVMDESLQGDILNMAADALHQTLESKFPNNHIDDVKLVEKLAQQTVRRVFNRHRGRKPTVITQLVMA